MIIQTWHLIYIVGILLAFIGFNLQISYNLKRHKDKERFGQIYTGVVIGYENVGGSYKSYRSAPKVRFNCDGTLLELSIGGQRPHKHFYTGDTINIRYYSRLKF